jgi:hypothetical protein
MYKTMKFVWVGGECLARANRRLGIKEHPVKDEGCRVRKYVVVATRLKWEKAKKMREEDRGIQIVRMA